MKNALVFTFLVISILFLSNTLKNEKQLSPLVVTSLGDTPVLPTIPYKYSFSVPDHLISPPDPSPGYGSGQIDTTILPLINNDVATLGRVLFYDKVLSSNEDISCASCHIQANSFADKKRFSVGQSNPTTRNSMHLNDLGWSNNKFFFWDIRHNNLSGAVSLPLKDKNEIGATIGDVEYKISLSTYYPDLFRKAFGSEDVTETKILDAIKTFIISMNSINSKFDQVMKEQATFTASENRGKEIFSKNCSTCHMQGNHSSFDNLGIKDRAEQTFNGYLDANGDKGATQNVVNLPALFKMPTLRNVTVTAPYMHDGGIPDLDSLINFYSHGVDGIENTFIPAGGFDYSNTEKADLKAFLTTLTDEEFLTNIKWSDPFDLSSKTTDISAKIAVRPNPSFNYALVTVDGKYGQRKDIFVTDISGKLVFQDYFTDNNYEINVQNFAGGIYSLTIKVGNEMGSYKIVTQ